MATLCPKCDYKLRIIDYKPECPKCGVNLLYYKMEERLREEADQAEYEFAVNAPKVDRIKAATIGTTLSKVRLGLYILPILATLLPLGKYALSLPFYEKAVTVNVVSLVQLVQNLNFDALMAMTKSAAFGTEFILLAVSLVSFLLMLVLMLVQWGMLILSCGPKGLVRNFTFNILGIVLLATSAITYNAALTNLSAAFPSVASASLNLLGVAGIFAAFLVCLATNVLQKVKGIEVNYRDVSEFLMPYDERPSTIAARAEEEEAVKQAEAIKEEDEKELLARIAAARAVNAVEDAIDH